MNALTILALVLMVPVILIPVVFIWYINIGGIYRMLKERKTIPETAILPMPTTK